MNNKCVVRGAWFNPAGFTLLEVIVVLAVMGLALGMSGLALASLKAPRESERIRELRQARAEAIRTGRPVHTGNNHARTVSVSPCSAIRCDAA